MPKYHPGPDSGLPMYVTPDLITQRINSMEKLKPEMAQGDLSSTERGTGARDNGGKVQLSLFPFHLLAGTCRVFMAGTLKYKAFNWAKGMPWSSCMDCLLRHLFKWWYCGEDVDPESGEHHLDHVMCNLLFLIHMRKTYPDGDDRPEAYTAFSEWLDDINTPFDKESFLERNPAIKAKVEGNNG